MSGDRDRGGHEQKNASTTQLIIITLFQSKSISISTEISPIAHAKARSRTRTDAVTSLEAAAHQWFPIKLGFFIAQVPIVLFFLMMQPQAITCLALCWLSIVFLVSLAKRRTHPVLADMYTPHSTHLLLRVWYFVFVNSKSDNSVTLSHDNCMNNPVGFCFIP